MTARAPTLPALDEGEPPTTLRALLGHLAPTPGRLGNTLLLLMQVTITLIVGEVFRLPEISVFVWIAFFLSGNDAASSLTLATLSGGMILLGTGLVILFLTFSLSEPALRLPIMFVLTLGAGFLSQAMTMGALANVLLFWIVYMATNADLLEQVGFSLDAFVGNTTSSAVSDAVFLPPEESLVHVLLWIGAIFVVALAILITVNLAFGRDPAVMLKGALAGRLRAVAAVLDCGGAPEDPSARRILELARDGVAGLRKLHDLAVKLHRDPQRQRMGLAMIRDVGRLVMVACAWTRLPAGTQGDRDLAEAAALVRLCADVVDMRRDARDALAAFEITALDRLGRMCKHDPARHPLALELVWTLKIIRSLLLRREVAAETVLPEILSQPRSLFKVDAFRNPTYYRASAKLGLSVTICYAIERFTDWPGIGTCVVTCFLVSLGTVGDSVHKMTLRVGGALTGAFFGIGSILWIMPFLTDLSDLLLLVLPVSFLAAWVKCGSERIAYAGVQMAFAFYLCVLQGYGPTLDMETGRNRVVGILVGNIVVYLVSTMIWPVSVESVARIHLVRAVQFLGKLVVYRPVGQDVRLIDPEQERLREGFSQAIAAVRQSVLNDTFESRHASTSRHPAAINARMVTEIQLLSIPIAIVSDDASAETEAVRCQVEALRVWFDRLGAWIGDGQGMEALWATLPPPPDLPHDAERQFWFRTLDQRIRTILGELLPEPDMEGRHATA